MLSNSEPLFNFRSSIYTQIMGGILEYKPFC